MRRRTRFKTECRRLRQSGSVCGKTETRLLGLSKLPAAASTYYNSWILVLVCCGITELLRRMEGSRDTVEDIRHGPSAWLLWWCGCGGGCLRITFDFDFFNFIIRKKNIPNFVNKLKIVNDLMFKATHIDNLLDRNERLNTKSN